MSSFIPVSRTTTTQTFSSQDFHSAETNAEKIHRKLKGADKAERTSRICDQVDKMGTDFTKRQIKIIKQVIRTNEPHKGSLNTKEFAMRLHGLVIKNIKNAIDCGCSPAALEGLTLDKFEKLAKSASPYQVAPLEPVTVGGGESERLAAAYDEGEEIPEYVSTFDTTHEHTLNVKKYIDVRVSHTIQDTITNFQKKGKNVEVFIGSVKDMRKYYASKGYHPVDQLVTNNSNKYMVFASADGESHKLVIAGISNKSRFNNVLMQLKFMGANLEKVTVHGSVEAAMQDNVLELRKRLTTSKDGAEPTLAFIGNRSIVFIELAKYLYPGKIKEDLSEDEQEKLAEQLLAQHNFRTEDIDKVFKFSCATVSMKGKPCSIAAFRMPNGSLSGLATKEILRTGYKHLVMVGAGGSLSKEQGGGLGAMQIVESSSYQGHTCELHRRQIMPIEEMEAPGADVHTGCSNVTVDGPLEEHREWERQVKQQGRTSVDVETYHIFDAISHHERDDLRVLPGLFNSDVVGENPLEDKITANNAYSKFPAVLKGVFKYEGVSK